VNSPPVSMLGLTPCKANAANKQVFWFINQRALADAQLWGTTSREVHRMDYDKDKIDEMVLALLYLTMFPEAGGTRAWKGHAWEALDRLHAKGYISDPKSKAKSVWMSDEGVQRARDLFERHFARKV